VVGKIRKNVKRRTATAAGLAAMHRILGIETVCCRLVG
jgi:hypothetical protein